MKTFSEYLEELAPVKVRMDKSSDAKKKRSKIEVQKR